MLHLVYRSQKLQKLAKTCLNGIAAFVEQTGLIDSYGAKNSFDGAVVLLYHRIDGALFEEHITYLRRHWQIVSLDTLVESMTNGDAPLKNAVVISFDDGYRSVYQEVFPAIQLHKVPIVVYLVSDFIGTERAFWWDKPTAGKLGRAVLSMEEIREMVESNLVTMGSHTKTHPRLTHFSEPNAREEIQASKTLLEDKLEIPIRHFAYPHGDFATSHVGMVREAGYRSGASTIPGVNEKATSPYLLRRIGAGNANTALLGLRVSGLWTRLGMDRPLLHELQKRGVPFQ